MITPQCVRCGTSLSSQTLDLTNRLVAPCCSGCREAVIKQVRKNYRDWPFDYRGGWLWDGKMWVIARKMDGTYK